MYNEIFFSEYDKSITGSTQRDPLGLQPIWSYYGRRIIPHLSTISTHLHGFREVLLCLSICSSVLNTQKKLGYYELILLFEQLFIYTAIKKKNKLANKSILGADNGNSIYQASDCNPVISVENTILVRQISLGYYGRYKTPLSTMGIIDHKSVVALDEEFVKKIYGVQNYQKILSEFQNFVLLKKWKFDCFDAKDDLFSAVFGKFRNAEKKFWLEKFQINGRSKLDLMDESFSKVDQFETAKDVVDSLTQKSDVLNVVKLEPFLRCVEDVFYKALKAKTLDDIKIDVNAHKKCYDDFMGITDDSKIDPKSLFYERIEFLRKNCSPNSTTYIKKIIEYHVEVCKQKKSACWLEIDSKNRIQSFVNESLFIDILKWGRDYYFNSLASIKREFQEFSNG